MIQTLIFFNYIRFCAKMINNSKNWCIAQAFEQGTERSILLKMAICQTNIKNDLPGIRGEANNVMNINLVGRFLFSLYIYFNLSQFSIYEFETKFACVQNS